ncbi:MAG: DUF3737 family protein [Clostridia bacterium]|nr:DUF3737 family protein [Clostridia bacterium]
MEESKYKVYNDQRFGEERALYGAQFVELYNCKIDGEEDGESFLKESRRVKAFKCYFALRYPLWHSHGVSLTLCNFTDTSRAAIWYSKSVYAKSCDFKGIKALRECSKVTLESCRAVSQEFGWFSKHITVKDTEIESEYAFLGSKDIQAEGLTLTGKYSFQYAKKSDFTNCTFKTKDAFWHSRNVTVTDSVIDGEFLGWYSENLTLINCHIKGTQPLCYCRGLKLINCTTESCDRSFEYSDVDAGIKGDIVSVKNVRSGIVAADSIGEIIITDDSKVETKAEIIERSKMTQ